MGRGGHAPPGSHHAAVGRGPARGDGGVPRLRGPDVSGRPRLFGPLLALVRLETGRPDQALGLAAEILLGGEERLPTDNGWLFGMTMLAEVTSRIGDRELAALQYGALEPFAAQVGTGANEIASGSIHRPLGQLASVLASPRRGTRPFRRPLACVTVRIAPTSGSPTPTSTRQWRDLRRGTDDDVRIAAGLLRNVGETSRRERWGSARRSRRQSPAEDRARPGSAVASRVREVEVARLVSQGRTNREMAEQFVLSERTVETHVQHILTKLGFTSRAEIAVWAVRSGLSGDP